MRSCATTLTADTSPLSTRIDPPFVLTVNAPPGWTENDLSTTRSIVAFAGRAASARAQAAARTWAVCFIFWGWLT